VPVRALIPFLNDRMLFQFHWGFRKQGKRLDEYMEWAQKEVRPILIELLQRAIKKNVDVIWQVER